VVDVRGPDPHRPEPVAADGAEAGQVVEQVGLRPAEREPPGERASGDPLEPCATMGVVPAVPSLAVNSHPGAGVPMHDHAHAAQSGIYCRHFPITVAVNTHCRHDVISCRSY
jgi:hypothetical protein